MILQIGNLCLWLILVPLGIGCIPAYIIGGKNRNPIFAFCSGYMCMWAAFQLFTVPCVIREWKVDVVVKGFTVLGLILAMAGLGIAVISAVKNRKHAEKPILMTKGQIFWWGMFGALLLFQLYKTITCAYADGDDAFYIATASIAEESNEMYKKLPYTGGAMGVDIGYGLAPFPIWLAFLARISGSNTAFVAHVPVAACMVFLTYMIYVLLGRQLFSKEKEKIPVFLVFSSLLILFGNYSIYTGETFLLTRSRQGKAALASAVIPFLLLVVLMIGERLKEGRKPGAGLFLLLMVTVTAACLCSTMGTFLAALFVAAAACVLALCFKKWSLLFPMALCCLPSLVYVGIYVILS